MAEQDHTLHVWGPVACFTRPELKVERVSYPVITPSAARGIFESIFWQPGLSWRIQRIEVLRPIRTLALRRNEVKDKAPPADTILRWANGRATPEPLWADEAHLAHGRTQRQTLALRDVAYRVRARLVTSTGQPSPATLKAASARFQRRVKAGACHQQPYFGCREFACYFEEARADGPPPCPINLDIGLMLYDVFPLDDDGCGKARPSLFRACLKEGVLQVPDYSSDSVIKGIVSL